MKTFVYGTVSNATAAQQVIASLKRAGFAKEAFFVLYPESTTKAGMVTALKALDIPDSDIALYQQSLIEGNIVIVANCTPETAPEKKRSQADALSKHSVHPVSSPELLSAKAVLERFGAQNISLVCSNKKEKS